MKIDGRHYRSIWLDPDGASVRVIDQTKLPFAFETRRLSSLDDAVVAIRDMIVRGAPLIGAVGAYGLALAARDDASDGAIARAYDALNRTRPTAVNLRWALD
ncbi:MAG: S-methyl-5-thioribose-1-phosphate isomerase, partial [Methylocystis sp.]